MQIVYFSSTSENTHRFVQKLTCVSHRIPLNLQEHMVVDSEYILICPTYSLILEIALRLPVPLLLLKLVFLLHINLNYREHKKTLRVCKCLSTKRLLDPRKRPCWFKTYIMQETFSTMCRHAPLCLFVHVTCTAVPTRTLDIHTYYKPAKERTYYVNFYN